MPLRPELVTTTLVPCLSMSHYDVALLWQQLEKRLDIENILQESLGQVFLLRDRPEQELEAEWLKTIILCKNVFDLQRVYLQAKKPAASSSAILLQPEIIVATTECLINFTLEQYRPRLTEGRRYDGDLVYHLRQTAISGLRAYQLSRQKSHFREQAEWISLTERLRRCFDKWPKVEEIDQYLSHHLFKAGTDIDHTRRPESSNMCSEHPTLDLPDFHEGSVSTYTSGDLVSKLIHQ